MVLVGENEAGRLKAGLLGFREGMHQGADNERSRLAELLGTSAGTLALLGASQEEDLSALREIQSTVSGRVDEIVEAQTAANALDIKTGPENE